MVMETGPSTKPDPNLRFHKIEIHKSPHGLLKVDGSGYIEKNDRKKYRQILKELIKHVGQLIRDNKQFFEYSKLYGETHYIFETFVNPWGNRGPDAHRKNYYAVCYISSFSTESAGEKIRYPSRFDIGPDEWFQLYEYFFNRTWDFFMGHVLFDYTDPDNIKVRTSWLEQAILKKRQEEQGKVPSLFTMATQALNTSRQKIPTNVKKAVVRTTDTFKRKRDINDVQVTVQGYVF